MIRTGTYRYVAWSLVERFMAHGWIPGNVAAGDYSVIMWACECNPNGDAPQ